MNTNLVTNMSAQRNSNRRFSPDASCNESLPNISFGANLNESLNNLSFNDSSLKEGFNLERTPNGCRIRLRNIKYEGDPDLHPIRSYENAFLVRTLYYLAQKINTIVSNNFNILYEIFTLSCS